MKQGLKKIIIVIIGILLNITGRYIAGTFELPVWLDMFGTVIATYYGGLWVGMIAGISNNIVSFFFDSTALIYSVTSVMAAILIHIFVKKGYFENALKAIVSSFWLGVLCTAVSTPLNIIFYNGYTGNRWGDTLIDMLKWNDVSLPFASLAGDAIVEIVDKQVCVMLAFAVIRLTANIAKRKSNTNGAVSLALAVAALVCSTCQAPIEASAEGKIYEDNFVEEIYNNTSGMVSSEANSISETDDGYIWIGSYAGLSRYDGSKFEFIREGGIVNVVGMLTDSKGRLWIATNDAGITRYENGKFTTFTVDDGLPTNSIRCFSEDENGNIYVGTSEDICKFTPDDTIEVLSHDITFAKTMTVYNGFLIVTDNSGAISAMKDDTLYIFDNPDGYFFYTVSATSDRLLAGTETGELFVMDITDSGMSITEKIDVPTNKISSVFEDSQKRIWLATEIDFGYIGTDGVFRNMHYNGFDSSVECFLEDYQGNIWAASSNYGVLKLSVSPFMNISDKIGTSDELVNAVVEYNGCYFYGTDIGLGVFDGDGINNDYSDITELTKGLRVRSLFVDSENRLWICSYSGLICYNGTDETVIYNMENNGTTSDRFRCIAELSDGTLVTGTSDGINFIKDGELIAKLTGDDGLSNTQILSITQAHDGTVWAGSDGSGIYVITDGKLTKTYTVDDGLSSNVILRIVPYDNGYIIVTSNALCHIDKDGNIKKLSEFPYFNNYDVILDGETAYVTCSAGVYQLKLADLCNNKIDQYKLYSAGEGLLSGLTANSWNYITDDGKLYLCSNSGVIMFNADEAGTYSEVKFGLSSVEADGTSLDLSDGNNIVIPTGVADLSIYASVYNYSFSDVKVKFFIKEMTANPELCEWRNLEPIRLYKPDFSQYTVCLQIYDSTGDTLLEEKQYTIGISEREWEKTYFKVYLSVVVSEIIIIAIISIVSMALFVIRKNELEKARIELETKVSEQTGEIRAQQQKIQNLFLQTVTALSEAVDAKDRYTSGHSKRVAEYARMIAIRMGKSKEEQEEIYRAGLLHDIGKIRIPVDIINKAGSLTEEEYNIIKIHPVTGYNILRGISDNGLIAIAAKHHHERYDGAGYPNGLVGEKIPEVARILGVADSYDAMTSNRSYRRSLPQDVVRSEIINNRGTQFDPVVADIMLQMIDEDTEYKMKQDELLHKRILTVDDEYINNKLILNIMSDEPMYSVVTTESAKEALALLEKESFDLILLDVLMPEMDGFETLKLIREKYNTPVVLMTEDKTLNIPVELGCDDYVTKPFTPLLIKEVIHNTTERTNIS